MEFVIKNTIDQSSLSESQPPYWISKSTGRGLHVVAAALRRESGYSGSF